MRIAIDASNLTGAKTGLDFMTEGIIQGFKAFPEHELIPYTTDKYLGETPEGWVRIAKPKGLFSGLRWYFKASRDMRGRGVDVFISTWTFTAAALFPRTIQIVPDLSPMVLPETVTIKHRIMFTLTLWVALLRAWKVVAISQAVADEIKQKFPWYKKEIGVIPLSVNDWALSPQTSETERAEIRSKYQLPEKFFLSVSTIQPRKNYVNMIKGFGEFAKSHPDFNYVIVGKKGWKYAEVFAEVEKLQIQDKVKFLDYLPDFELAALTDASQGFLYASIYEGFGIPPLNAAYRGIPVLVSDIPVFHEILTSNDAIFVDSQDVQSIAQGLTNLSQLNTSFGNNKLIKKFNWANCAKTLINQL
ncbi:MAG: glycosyltransferase family 4 protein [Candidatus Doudnabacteria bacterium]|nr:glycosyltransferase family 4 protein [Candidatus Doudnabacteria bacterium]